MLKFLLSSCHRLPRGGSSTATTGRSWTWLVPVLTIACCQSLAVAQQPAPPASNPPASNRPAEQSTPTEQASAAEQSTPQESNDSPAEPWPPLVKLSEDLPEPPADIQQLLDAGNVTFSFYDAGQTPRRFQGETRLKLDYTVQSEFQWRLTTRSGSKKLLIIRPIFKQVTFASTHKILLPAHLAGEDFFNQPLVLHELDHVRTSVDKRFLALFKKWLADDLRVLRVECRTGDRYEEIAQNAINAEADQRFEKLLELIRVRYRELDRLTQHGVRPTPATFFAP